MAITPLPTPPSRSDPANFADRGDAFLGALPTFATEANDLAAAVNQNEINAELAEANAEAAQLAAENARDSAQLAENNAEAAVVAAFATANATLWVSGTTYAIGDNVYSPINFLTYRRTTNGGGTTDPSQDITNWKLLGGNVSINNEVIGTNTNAITFKFYVLTASLTLTLPSSPVAGDWVGFRNASATTTPVIARNGSNIMSLAEDMTLDNENANGILSYVDSTRGWILI